MSNFVTSEMVKQTSAEAMIQMGQCLQKLIATLTEKYDKNTPFKSEKLDIKDGV